MRSQSASAKSVTFAPITPEQRRARVQRIRRTYNRPHWMRLQPTRPAEPSRSLEERVTPVEIPPPVEASTPPRDETPAAPKAGLPKPNLPKPDLSGLREGVRPVIGKDRHRWLNKLAPRRLKPRFGECRTKKEQRAKVERMVRLVTLMQKMGQPESNAVRLAKLKPLRV